MSSIYDKKINIEKLDGGLTGKSSVGKPSIKTDILSPQVKVEQPEQPVQSPQYAMEELPNRIEGNSKEVAIWQERSSKALSMVDDIVLKNYLTRLSQMEVLPVSEEMGKDNIILFKINKMVYEKDEYATDKFISIVSAMTYTSSSIYLIVDGKGDYTDFYLGIKCNDDEREKSSVAETFKDSILGQFPGAVVEDFSLIESDKNYSRQDRILHRLSDDAVSISSCVGVPSYKNSKGEYTNANFIQGIEKLATAMHGKNYTAVILAANVSHNEIVSLRNGYESVYTEISAMATRQLAYSTNESLAHALSRTKGYSDAVSQTETSGTSESHGTSHSHTDGKSSTTTKTKGTSQENGWGKAGKLASPLMEAGAILTATGVGAPLGVVMMGTGAIAGVGSFFGSKQKSDSTSQAEGTNTSDTDSTSDTFSKNHSKAKGKTHTENFNETDGTTSTVGSSKNFTITIQNKHIQEIQKRIDKQLERIEMCESTGLWSTGAYFVSYGTDRATAETASTIFRSIMQGEQSGVETSAINTWYNNPISEVTFKNLLRYVSALSHPIFQYNDSLTRRSMQMLPTSLLSSKELAIMIGLPRKSVPGLPVIEHISLGKEVVRLNDKAGCKCNQHIELGCIFDQGVERVANKVLLDTKSLTQHTFVTGSTGCGKSNTIYYLIKQIRNQANAPKFLVIEPAKGEYKDVFGNEHIYGTNPLKTPLLKINPFRFTDGVHVLEHIDRLIEIFNVCWPMYAAMPAVLKEAILNAYEDCGWDLYESKNKYSDDIFPTFADLLDELILVINNSAYSEEVKSNYQGSLVTRVKSLNNGLCKQIFSGAELGDSALFDENVIIDLSRIGSQETKSLLMGILIMRLNEYRANSGIEHNSALRHVTILEEAHNILKRCSQEQSSEGSNVAGKSVEMISNAIAEMRTYGEGFIIVDQSPGAVDISAIRNTNTKIIMRLPEEDDRHAAGKASGMKNDQIDEIAKLPTGVAVVYQNDWEEPVLCKIGKFDDDEISFEYIREQTDSLSKPLVSIPVLTLFLNGRLNTPLEFNIDLLEDTVGKSDLSTFNKIVVYDAINEYRTNGKLNIWNDSHFESLSKLVTSVISAKAEVKKVASTVSSFDLLTDKLQEIVKYKVPAIPEELILVASQCLMRDYSLDGEVQKRIYNAWFQSTINKKML